TPLLCPVWCDAISLSFSKTATLAFGYFLYKDIPVERPTIPPPTIKKSYIVFSSPYHSSNYFFVLTLVKVYYCEFSASVGEIGIISLFPIPTFFHLFYLSLSLCNRCTAYSLIVRDTYSSLLQE